MSSPTRNTIFTVVSRPGPVEVRILEGLAPSLVMHRRVGAGVSLRTLESAAPSGSGKTIVFLHGRGHAATIWSPILASLAREHHVVAVDLPGFGHSGAAPFDGSRPEDGLRFFVDPVEDLLASMPPSEGGLILIGHSLGGLCALAIALGKRVPVRAIGLVGAMGLGPTMTTSSRLYLRSSPERLARIRARLGLTSRGTNSGASDLDALRVELLTVRGGRPQASRAFDTMVPLVGPVFHLRDRLGEVQCPVLLLWGERDEAFPLPIAIDAQARFPQAELSVLDTAHSPHVEDPAGSLAVLSRFAGSTAR